MFNWLRYINVKGILEGWMNIDLLRLILVQLIGSITSNNIKWLCGHKLYNFQLQTLLSSIVKAYYTQWNAIVVQKYLFTVHNTKQCQIISFHKIAWFSTNILNESGSFGGSRRCTAGTRMQCFMHKNVTIDAENTCTVRALVCLQNTK